MKGDRTREGKHLTLRARVAGSFLAGAILVSSAVSGATYLLTSSYLTRQRIDTLVRQSFNTVRSAEEFLGRTDPPSPEQLIGLLKARTSADLVLKAGPDTYSTSISVAHESLPQDLASQVARGSVAYSHMKDPDGLILGTPLPANGWELFFVYPFTELPQTLSLLWRILVAVAGSAIVVAGLVGWRISGTIVRPLQLASEAAHRVARGLIETRLEEASNDELGLLAGSFNQMADALQQRIARERRFVADASHELRTPLTSLAASVEYLVQRTEGLSEDMKSTATLALDQVRSLRRLVDELLELSKMEARSEVVQEEEVGLALFLHEVIRKRAPGRDVELIVSPPDISIITDKTRLERSVGNLVENAVTHGGASEVSVMGEHTGDSLTITVTDRGPGLRREDLPHIFEPFWRADSTRRRGHDHGSGLGLAIAKESARVLNGTLDVSSAEGETRFTLRLPGHTVILSESP